MHDLQVAIEVGILDCTFPLLHTYAISRDSSASPTLSRIVRDFPGQLSKMHFFANMRSFTFSKYVLLTHSLQCV